MMNMKMYSGWQWLLIDAANQHSQDKELFEDRIKWAEDRLADLESYTATAEKKPLFIKAVMAIRKAQQGIATGHMVGVDAACSGIQIMSVLTGCVNGARATGLVDPNRRADAYTETTQLMVKHLGGSVNVSRADAKRGVMTSYYGSKKTPKDIFGEDTPELNAFYAAINELAPGAWELLQILLASWRPYALSHDWKLPDGFDARVKVMSKKEVRIEVDELDGATFTYEFYENEGEKKGLANVANMTHSMDAYVLREMHRRCNYDAEVMANADRAIEMELIQRSMGKTPSDEYLSHKVSYYRDQYARSTLASSVIFPYITEDTVQCLSTEHLQALAAICQGMHQYRPFPLVTVHDEFKSHANNVNWVRWTYREILAEIAESNVLDDLLSQIYQMPGSTFDKLSFNLADLIRKSNYALC
jgi:hypothetical protein